MGPAMNVIQGEAGIFAYKYMLKLFQKILTDHRRRIVGPYWNTDSIRTVQWILPSEWKAVTSWNENMCSYIHAALEVVVTVVVVVMLWHRKEFHSPLISPIGGGHGGCGSNAQASKSIPFSSHIPDRWWSRWLW
jgi:hypothetical protein